MLRGGTLTLPYLTLPYLTLPYLTAHTVNSQAEIVPLSFRYAIKQNLTDAFCPFRGQSASFCVVHKGGDAMRVNHNRPPGDKHRIRGADQPTGRNLTDQELPQFQQQEVFS